MWIVLERTQGKRESSSAKSEGVGPFDTEADAKKYVEERLQGGDSGKPFSIHEVRAPD